MESLYRDIDLNFVGPKCSEAGITCSILKDILFEISDENINEGSNTHPKFILTNGIVLEILLFKSRENFTQENFKFLLCALGNHDPFSLISDALMYHVKSLSDKKHSLYPAKNKDLLQVFLSENFQFPVRRNIPQKYISDVIQAVLEWERIENKKNLDDYLNNDAIFI